MSNFREGDEVSWFVNNRTPSGRIIKGTVDRVSNNKITVKNFRPMNDKPYATGRPTMNINRKNFINTQYVLYQLLLRHKHSCKKEDFIILKTIDRKYFHDEICKSLFEHLGWNFSPFY